MTKRRTPRTVLSPREKAFLDHLSTGIRPSTAAVQAGYSKSFAQKAESRILNRPLIRAEWEKIQAAAREHAGYTLEAAAAAVDKAIVFAYAKNSPIALSKLLEHKAKLYGLLIEKVDLKTTHIDLKGALEEARARVLNVTSRHEPDTTASLPGPASCSRGPSLNE